MGVCIITRGRTVAGSNFDHSNYNRATIIQMLRARGANPDAEEPTADDVALAGIRAAAGEGVYSLLADPANLQPVPAVPPAVPAEVPVPIPPTIPAPIPAEVPGEVPAVTPSGAVALAALDLTEGKLADVRERVEACCDVVVLRAALAIEDRSGGRVAIQARLEALEG